MPGPQLARGVERTMVAAAERLLAALAPEGARSVKVGVSVFRRMARSPVFEARGFVQWVTTRGRPDAASVVATGLEPGGARNALAKLLTELKRAAASVSAAKPPPAKRRPAASAKATKKPRAPAAKKARAPAKPGRSAPATKQPRTPT